MSGLNILLVDDEPELLSALNDFLGQADHSVTTARNGAEALRALDDGGFQLVLTDISMPELGGLELLDHVKDHDEEIDVIMITGYLDISYAIQAMRRGAYDFFTKPLNFEKVLLTVDRVAERQHLQANARRYEVLKREQELQLETTLSLARAAEGRDRLNIGHGKRVAKYSVDLAKRLCFNDEKLDQIRYAGLLHDIGKIGIDDAILNKPGKLTDTEYQTMKRHSDIADYILRPVSILGDVAAIVRSHHECFDGSGYPDGLAGDEIPLESRIICIADFFDAITSVRPYRQPMALDKAIGLVNDQSGKMFDPMLVETFVEMMSATSVPTEAQA